jgi:hypothetical protein
VQKADFFRPFLRILSDLSEHSASGSPSRHSRCVRGSARRAAARPRPFIHPAKHTARAHEEASPRALLLVLRRSGRSDAPLRIGLVLARTEPQRLRRARVVAVRANARLHAKGLQPQPHGVAAQPYGVAASITRGAASITRGAASITRGAASITWITWTWAAACLTWVCSLHQIGMQGSPRAAR